MTLRCLLNLWRFRQRNLLANRTDLTEDQIKRTATLMNKAVPDALVTGFEPLIDSIDLPDLRKPPVSVDEYLEALLRQGMAQTVKELSKYRMLI